MIDSPMNRSPTRGSAPGMLFLLPALWSAGCAPAEEAPVAPRLVPGPVVDHLDQRAREPMVVEHPDGTVFVTGFGAGRPMLYRSRDGGVTWSEVDVGSAEDGAVGNSDADLAVGPDGSVHLVTMDYDRGAREGRGIAVGSWRGGDEEWSWTLLSRDRFDDRPWIEATPDGVLHVIWNDGAGVSHATSEDAGRTWQERPRIHSKGGSSHLAVGPGGELAVRITPVSASGHQMHEDADFIAVSLDGGTSWELTTPPGSREWTFPIDDAVGVPRWVEPVAWDAEGALYSLWAEEAGEGATVLLGRSIDHGNTWTVAQVASGDDVLYFPYLAGNGAGEVAATWFSGRYDDLEAHVAHVTVDPSTGELVGAPSISLPVETFFEYDEGQFTRETAGEYVPVVFRTNGDLAVVSTIQNAMDDRWGFRWHPVTVSR